MDTRRYQTEFTRRADAHIKKTGRPSAAGHILVALAFVFLAPRTSVRLSIELAIMALNVYRLVLCLPGTSLRRQVLGFVYHRYSVVVSLTSLCWTLFSFDLITLHDTDHQQTVFILLTLIGLCAAGSAALALLPKTYFTLLVLVNILPALDMILGPHRLVDWPAVPYTLLVYAGYLWRQSREHREVLHGLINAEILSAQERDNFDAVLNAIPSLVLGLNDRGAPVSANQSLTDAFGLSLEDLLNTPLANAPLPAPLRNALAAFVDSDAEGYVGELLLDHGAQSRRFTVAMRRIDDPFIRVIAVCHDVEDERRAQATLLEQQVMLQNSAKMAALGTMAGGIAHEINNPLAIISGKMQMLRAQIRSKSIDVQALETGFDKVIQTVDRIAKIITGMRQISRDGTKDPFQLKRVNALIEEVVPVIETAVRAHGIELRVTSVASEVEISCRIVEISQILVNLVSNAADAITAQPGPRWIEISAFDEATAVVITVTDSGPGIPPDLREKIMQPFFTTKGVGKGTGVGLSISQAIAEAHGGRIQIDTRCPNTRFRLELPRPAERTKAA